MTHVTTTTDIEYRPAREGLEAQAFDLFTPDEVRVPGVFIFLHGGGWRAGDKSGSGLPKAFAEAGIRTVSANYTLTPAHPYPQNVEDVFSVIDFVATHPEALGVGAEEAQQIFIGGTSAGGHLSSLAVTKGLAEHRLTVVPKAVISWYAPLDPISRFLKHQLPARNFPGSFWSRLPDRPQEGRDPFVPFIGTDDFATVNLRDAIDGDPRYHLLQLLNTGVALPPFLLLVGTHDSDEIRYSQHTWYSALKYAGVNATLIEIEDLDHADPAFASAPVLGSVIGTLHTAAQH